MNAYPIKTETRLSVIFTNETSAAADPISIALTITPPGADPIITTELVRDSVGHYHYDYLVEALGVHHYKFQGSGGLNVASSDKVFRGIA